MERFENALKMLERRDVIFCSKSLAILAKIFNNLNKEERNNIKNGMTFCGNNLVVLTLNRPTLLTSITYTIFSNYLNAIIYLLRYELKKYSPKVKTMILILRSCEEANILETLSDTYSKIFEKDIKHSFLSLFPTRQCSFLSNYLLSSKLVNNSITVSEFTRKIISFDRKKDLSWLIKVFTRTDKKILVNCLNDLNQVLNKNKPYQSFCQNTAFEYLAVKKLLKSKLPKDLAICVNYLIDVVTQPVFFITWKLYRNIVVSKFNFELVASYFIIRSSIDIQKINSEFQMIVGSNIFEVIKYNTNSNNLNILYALYNSIV